jgi:hypothetical protein
MTVSERRIPWYLWCAALAVTSAYVGGYWDISWHRSIGRDSFWSAPHIAIYACGVLAGISSAYLILTTTFPPSPQSGYGGAGPASLQSGYGGAGPASPQSGYGGAGPASPQSGDGGAGPASPQGGLGGAGTAASLRGTGVRIWGLSGPIGAFISAWGGMAMLVSAPFDDWWHNAYGLDVKIISPPHMVLATGFFGIEFGTIMLLLAFMNRASDRLRTRLQWLFLYVGGTTVCESLLIKLEYISRPEMHGALFYIVVAIGTPAIMVALAMASRQRWACTAMAAVYTAFGVGFLWILPLFAAEPKLGPVYHQVTHFIPWEFPLLLIIPAVIVDLILQRTDAWRPILRALVTGAAFLVTFIVVQWPFANFLMTPLARNRVFGTAYFDYGTSARSVYARYVFLPEATPAQFWRGMLIALAVSSLMMWIGLRAGRGMQRVRR